MDVHFEKKIWFEAKAKLQRLYSLKDVDFHYQPGEECTVPEKVRKLLKMSKLTFYKLIPFRSKNNNDTNINEYSNP